jgi:uncharacterized membrane protein YphA (DoxX/SURF4 family)
MFMTSFTVQTYALMRIVAGFLFLWHGTQKLFGYPVAVPVELPALVRTHRISGRHAGDDWVVDPVGGLPV